MDKEIVKIVARMTGEKITVITKIVSHYTQYIAGRIEEGRLENVRVPLFGIFRVNLKKLKYEVHTKAEPKTKLIRRPKSTK